MKNLKYLSFFLITLFSNAQRLNLDTLEDVDGDILTLGAGFQEFDLGNNCILFLQVAVIVNDNGFARANAVNGAYDWNYNFNTVMRLSGFVEGIADFRLTNQGLNSDSYNRFEGSFINPGSSTITPSYAGGDGTPVFFFDTASNGVSHYTQRPPPEIVQMGRDDTEVAVTEASSAHFDFRGSSFTAITGYGDDDTFFDEAVFGEDDNTGIPSDYIPNTSALTDSWSITIANHVIPEPSSLIFIGVSGFGLIVRRRR